MLKFLLGFVLGAVAIATGLVVYLRLGYLDSRADIPENAIEQQIAMPALDASVDRHAPGVSNPVDSSDASLLAGMNIYQTNCAGCHGDISHPQSALTDSLYPRAAQFMQDSPDMPENQNFYIVEHGVRLSGMPAWKQSLGDLQIWQVTTFLSHMDKLPPEVASQWKAQAGAPAAGSDSGMPANMPGMNMPGMKMH